MPKLDAALAVYVLVLAFLFGSCVGSFVTCAADRFAAGESVLRGRSKCPSCGRTLGVLDLIPVFSYLFLRGKCRKCGAKIPSRCLIAELLSGVALAAVIARFGFTLEALEIALLLPVLLAAALIDFDTMEIPDGIGVYGAALFLIFTFFARDPAHALKEGLLGSAVIGGGMFVLSLVMDAVLKRESLGGGDVKLLLMLGLHTGLAKGLLMLIVACIVGLLLAIPHRKGGSKEFPFGPAIAVAALLTLLFGGDAIRLYLSILP